MPASPSADYAAATPLHTGPLQPTEVAHAAVMAALTAACSVISVVVPFAQALSLLATVPMGLLAYRYRPRVLVASTCAASAIAFLASGLMGFSAVAISAYIGGLTGIVKRKGRGPLTVTAVATIAAVLWGLVIVGVLVVMLRLRELIFGTIVGNAEGLARMMSWLPSLQPAADGFKDFVVAALGHWPLLMIGYSIVTIVPVSLFGWWVLARVLDRLSGIPDVHKLEKPADGTPGPLPVTLRDVRFRYPGAEHDALAPVDLDVDLGEHLAITGANGSGKTTLMLILTGRTPTSGTVDRPGSVALGEIGGTAVVLQHPETQVLGTRVADDVVWGLPPGRRVDTDALLAEVGLQGLQDRDTGGLSGGELQRLAIAGALAREPVLLIADEATSMVDQAGRDALLGVLSALPGRRPMSVVQITHYTGEAQAADRIVGLSESGDNTAMVAVAARPHGTERATAEQNPSGPAVIEVDHVSHEYGRGTPWAKPALHDVSFTVHEGDGVLIHGGNGSGKSTLAWIMAGLITPSSGRCRVSGRPATERHGDVAVAFQAARLQLMRPRVDLEIASAAGFSADDQDRVESALATVGLDASMARRRIDQLSGGQMRRVVLAGLLARTPRVLILDEPLAGVDAENQRNLIRLLEDLRRDGGLTVVVISHDFAGLEELCPRILHLNKGILAKSSLSEAGAL